MTEWESKISPEYIRQCFSMSSDGALTWKVRPASHFHTPGWHGAFNTRYANKPAGTLRCGGRYYAVHMMLDNVRRDVLAHRIVWVMVHGRWPDGHIDHINGNGLDNRPENLRDVSKRLNEQNQRKARPSNSTGLLGVTSRGDGRFVAQIRGPGVRRWLGSFPSPELAHAAYIAARTQAMESAGLTYAPPTSKHGS